MKNELFEKIEDLIRNKTILDVGCIDHDIIRSKESIWAHDFLIKNAKSVLGIDILEDEIKELNEKGYNIEYGNAETYTTPFKSEVVFAGAIIEHLSNQGKFLDCCYQNLEDEGKLIITTTNSFNLREVSKNLFTLNDNPNVNSEHTCYYTPKTITELIERHGFKVEKIKYYDLYGSFLGGIKFNFFNKLGRKFKRDFIVLAKKELRGEE